MGFQSKNTTFLLNHLYCQTFDVKTEVEVKLKTSKLLHCNKSFGNEKQKLKEYYMEYVHLVPRK